MVRISEKEGKDLTNLPLGTRVEWKGEINFAKHEYPENCPSLDVLYSKARRITVVNGEVVDFALKEEKKHGKDFGEEKR